MLTPIIYDLYAPNRMFGDMQQTLTYRGFIEPEAGDEALTSIDVLEGLFVRHNRDDRPDGQLGPSMSIGHLVCLFWPPRAMPAFTDNGIAWWQCTTAGFEQVEHQRFKLVRDRPWPWVAA